ncbi:hemagglutinin repeat-containing protein [Stutzerimonas zhaodongensis]|uniref:two-partner secretion domain-containing protein n=1 Tax=Stutzerimonas zhaodongensis TaxID=1176257 RepID=UPI00142D3EEB|nr:hemagglutinin repeat-containing protein [Stutzerimonas zhaodongensis]MCQ4317772.1 hemagglutinin repeat-containing protein [Stutzerimonas zhaodongensis]
MNKNLYRVVFNKARGLLMVVAENVSSQGKSPGASDGPVGTRCVAVIGGVRFAIMAALGLVAVISTPSWASGVVADSTAPSNQQPGIINSANGTPQINIRAPSAAGVSRNTYSQFDVEGKGVILNNSNRSVQTQLGGWIEGNPLLGQTSARVILNEVNAANPSQLRGYTEVAGQRAEVIIANPAGITCNGCGFINAERATLTTGRAQMENGRITGFDVTGGTLRIEGKGLDTAQSDYTNLIARAVEVNAGIWANDLKVTAGRNQVNADNTQAKPLADIAAEMPSVAIDVAQLGGMYAGKIMLIGTESGVGVRNAGQIGAMAGDVTISADGKIQNAGTISSAVSTRINSRDAIGNSGSLYAKGDAILESATIIRNSGTIAAQGDVNLKAATIVSDLNSTLAAGLTDDGELGRAGNLVLTAEQIKSNGQSLAGGDVTARGVNVNFSGGEIRAGNIQIESGQLDLSDSTVDASQRLSANATSALITERARVTADSLSIDAGTLSNLGGELVQSGTGSTTIRVAGALGNQDGRIASNGSDLRIDAAAVDNTKGRIEHAGNGLLDVQTESFDGSQGLLASNGSLQVKANDVVLDSSVTQGRGIFFQVGDLSNRGGKMLQVGDDPLSITATGRLDNHGGLISSSGPATLKAGMLDNTAGKVLSTTGGDLVIAAEGSVVNTNGTLGSSGAATLTASLFSNGGGTLSAADSLAVAADDLNNAKGTVAAKQDVTITTERLNNEQGVIGSVDSDLTISVKEKLGNAAGRLEAAGDISVNASGIDNAKGTISGHNLDLDAHGERLDNGGGTINAQAGLVSESGELLNVGGLIQSAGDLKLDTGSDRLVNAASGDAGGIVSQGELQILSAHVLNDKGFIAAKDDVLLQATSVINRGQVIGEAGIRIHGSNLANEAGTIQARSDIGLAIAQDINNTGGLIRSGSHLDIEAVKLDNSLTSGAETGIEGRSMRLAVDRVINRSGAIRADESIEIGASQSVDNDSGLISGGTQLKVSDRDPSLQRLSVSNTGGTLIAGNLLSLNAAYFSGTGRALSLGDLTFRSHNGLTNSGQFQANNVLDLAVAGDLTNSGSLVAGSLLLSAKSLNNLVSGEISASQVSVEASDSLVNRGLIDGQRVRLQANALTNLGTGRLYGDQLSVEATSLVNSDENGSAAVIAARDELNIGADVLSNREQSLIFSAGDLSIGKTLTADGKAQGRAQWLHNASATIESIGNLSMDVQSIRNTNEHFSTRIAEVSREAVQEYQLSGSSNRYSKDQITLTHDEVDYLHTPDGSDDTWNRYDYTRVIQETQIVSSAPAQILSGGNLLIKSGDVLNDNSRIIAGGLLQGHIDQLTNTELQGERVIADQGSVTNFYRKKKKGRDDQGSSRAAYTPAPVIQSISLSPAVYQQTANVVGTGTSVAGHGSQLVAQQVATTGALTANAGGMHQVGSIIEVAAQSSEQGSAVPEHVRTGGYSVSLPTSSLFKTNPSARTGFLIETDPKFASYRTWLSSDYMLDRLRIDPAQSQLRLGDGFYEQRLVREQIAQLTGRRFLEGYASDEQQYRSLIDNAVTVASEWQLVPGIALTAEQMASLTSDIVWLVEQPVTLPSGEVRTVLVPQVYVRVKEGDLDGSGALIAGQQLNLDISGDVINSGSLAGRSVMSLTAQNIDNLGGRIQADKASIQARENLNNLGGLIGAVDSLSLSAGQDITVASTTHESSGAQGGRTNLSRVAGLFVSGANGTMKVSAGNDVNLDAAQVVNAGDGQTAISAGRDINLGTVSEAHEQSIAWNASNWRKDASRTEVGSVIQSTGDLQLSAGQDINARGADVTSDKGMVLADAQRDINLTEAENYQFADEAHKFKGKSGMFSSKTTTTRDTVTQTLVAGSTVSGEQTYLQAGRDINVRGSNVVSTQQTILVADNNINIEAAADRVTERHDKTEKKSGLFSGGGIAVTIGSQQQSVEDESTRRTAVGSTIGSTDGDVLIAAGKDYRQVGSQVVAPKGDVDISAERIDILEARNISERARETKFKQTGVSITITNPVISAIQTAEQMKQASDKTDNSRMQTLALATTALSANNAATAVAQNPAQVGGVNISISLGSQKNENTVTQRSDTSAASTVAAGNDVTLTARGAGDNSSITVRGSQIKAGNNATLVSEGDINLLAATDRAEQQSDSEGSSASVGIGISFGGSQNGISFNLGVSANRGESDGEDVTHTNARVDAGNTLALISGRDTNLKGAVATGKQVIADVGRDLNIESLQDTSTYKVDEKSMGFGVSLCIPPFCYGASSVSGNIGKTDINSEFASVTEQSGIRAGDDGFQIRVGGNTDLGGAVITSSDKAIQDGRNTLSTATLTTRDIENGAKYSGSSISLGGGYGGAVGKDQQGNAQAGSAQTPGSTLPSEGGVSSALPVVIGARDSASSTTRSGISGAVIEIRDEAGQQALTGSTAEQTVASLNRDVSSDRDTSNALKPIFNEEEIRAGFQIVGALTNEVGTLLANKANEVDEKRRAADEAEAAAMNPDLTGDQALALLQSAQQLRKDAAAVADKWGAGGTYRQVTTALVAAAGGNVSASNGAFIQGLVVNYIQQQGAGYIGKLVEDGALIEGSPSHAALHGIVGCAGAAASSQSCGSGAAGAAASSLLTGLFSNASPNESETQREAKRNLIASLVTGLAAAGDLDAAAANASASAAIDNNWLATQQLVQAKKELKEAEGRLDELQVLAKWAFISKKQDLLTQSGVGLGLVEAGFDDVQGLSQMLMHPVETIQAIGRLINEPGALAGYPDEVKLQLQAKIDRIEQALTVGGDEHAVQLGRDMGELVWDVGGILTGVGGIAKGGVKLASVGIKLGRDSLEKMAVDSTKLLKTDAVDLAGGGKILGNPLREVEVSSGAKGAWTKELNKPEPNTIYRVDGNKTYQTDSVGRVEKVESNLSLAKNDRNTYQQCIAGKCGVSGDEGGHLIASVFNGPGEKLNLLPMNGNLNKGAWKKMENKWADALKQGQAVYVKIEPVYSGSGARPDRFSVQYSIDGGRPVIMDFKNSPGGI